MKVKDIVFQNESSCGILRRCLADVLAQSESLNEMIENSSDTDDFINKFLATPDYADTQAYVEIMKRERPERLWKAIRSMFGDRCFKTESDIGGVKVGNDEFSLIVPNGRGDGTTRVAVFDNKKDFNERLMNFFTDIRGKFSIYDYDCGGTELVTLMGKFGVYYYDGLVAFEKWN